MKKKIPINKKSAKRRLPFLEVLRDIKAYRSWIRTIKNEKERANSKFINYGLDHNYFYVLYLAITLPQEDAVLPDNIKRLRVAEMLTPIHQYLDNDLGFADYIVPEFNQFYDEENQPTLTYGIVYRFAFKKLGLNWIITRSIFIGFIIWALLKWPIISTLWEWIF
jgi:hypothetical protein